MRRSKTLVNLGMLLLTACTPLRAVLVPSEQDSSDIDWRELAPGLESTQLNGPGALSSRVIILRVSPELYNFRMHYRPGKPLSTEGWRAELPTASAIINANFYDANGHAIGWLVENGTQHVLPNPRFGGAFTLFADGASVLPRLPNEKHADQATQGFPTLVHAGRAASGLDGVVLARRSVIAEDGQGSILFILVTGIGTTLAALGEWLADLPLEVVNAVNLDGGGSSMLILSAGESLQLASRDAVPAVLAIYPRIP